MNKLDAVQMRLMREIADLHDVPEGAYNLRANGESVGRNTTASIDIISPVSAQITDNTAEKMVTDLKLLKILMAESAGKMIRADIRRDPTRFIASTMITAVTAAIRRL